jgi:hypothetical protein
LENLPTIEYVAKTAKEWQPPDFTVVAGVWQQMLQTGPRKHRLRWLLERGLWPETIEKARLGHTGDRFSIPVFWWGGCGGVSVACRRQVLFRF